MPLFVGRLADLEDHGHGHLAREVDQDRRQGRASWSLHHFPDGVGRNLKTSVRRDPAPDRRPTANPFAAMTGLGRDPSRSPDRTGVCCASVGTLSAHQMFTGRVSDQQIGPIKVEIVTYRPSLGPDSLRDALCTTFVGNHRKPSGESRLRYDDASTQVMLQ